LNLNIELDTKNNKCFANKILGETNYYIGLTKVCARCKNTIVGYPAISRKDNKTCKMWKCNNRLSCHIKKR